jgi:hypothetical protein
MDSAVEEHPAAAPNEGRLGPETSHSTMECDEGLVT